jgi:hypothetical protein
MKNYILPLSRDHLARFGPTMVRMRLLLLLFLLVSSSSTTTTTTTGEVLTAKTTNNDEAETEPLQLLEPTFTQHVGVLPPSVCEELIALGEEDGFTVVPESIDDGAPPQYKTSSQTIDVYERDQGIIAPAIYKVLEPWIPTITSLVKETIDHTLYERFYPNEINRTPKLHWVFFRRFSPTTDRTSLLVHPDSNMHSVNIALNTNYIGGGLFYLKPPANQRPDEDGRPYIPAEYRSYEWLRRQKRVNSTAIVYPTLNVGDLVIYNYTVYHGVAPVEVGTRYSFVLFYDMDNPAIQGDFYDKDDGLSVEFYHEITNVNISLVWVDVDSAAYGDGSGGTGGDVELLDSSYEDVIELYFHPFEPLVQYTYVGDIFRAVITNTSTILAEFVMTPDQTRYTVILDETDEEL